MKNSQARIVILLACLSILPLGALKLRSVLRMKMCGSYCFRMQRPAPYQDADYFSPEFIDESFSYPPPVYMKDNVLYTPDFSGKWINATGGHRKTAFQPAKAGHTVYFFGSSAMTSVEVPDDWTIPSQAQLLLPRGTGAENFGYAGASVVHQNDKLKSINLKKGDVVVFYDGVCDALVTFFLKHGSASGDEIPVNDKAVEGLVVNAFSGLNKMVMQGIQRTRSLLVKYAYFQSLFGLDPTFVLQGSIPAQMRDPDQLRRLQEVLRKEILARILEASRFSASKGARFIHFFQPTLKSDGRHSAYETDLMHRSGVVPAAFIAVFDAAKPVYEEVNRELGEAGVESHIIDDEPERPPGTEVYLDFCHLNHRGNKWVARKIAEAVLSGKTAESDKPAGR